MKRTTINRIMQGAFLFLLACAQASAQTDPLPSWNDGPAKKVIVEFVKVTTDKSSAKFVAPEARIAVFDQDGTTWVEQPMYTQVVYCLERVPAVVKAKPVLRLPEPVVQETTTLAWEGRTSSESTTVSTLDEADREHILRALEATGWRMNGLKGAAAMLKLHPSNFRFRMKKLGLTKVAVYTADVQKSNLH